MKICVIGGSVAGLECGVNLAERHDVAIYEEHREIGLPLKCAEGWINFSGVEPYVKGRKVKEVHMNLLGENFRVVDNFVAKGDALQIVSRPEMEQKMAEIAEKMGAEIITGKKMKIRDAAEQFDLIIDASGYPSQWCREFGGKKPYGFAIQAFASNDFDSVHVFFKERFDGYFWIFPMKYGGCKAGVGFFSKSPHVRMRELLGRFMESQGMRAKGFTASPVGCYLNKPLLRKFKVPVALVGDAAGLVDKGGGEGMSKAVISARILSSCINNSRLYEYEKRYFDFMSLHYMAANFFAFLRKNWKLLKTFGKVGFYDVAVKALRNHYGKKQI
ncbi:MULTISPECIES: NAD(P)/FAD-dependent oxidoreductase [unclassified Archaeoglobus]|uniref:NAD(P)/FAD-dependent oxidoreductase n=1 Tax=unclassified Archaeoglobus TaxID=2643606 RepID=UPI0025B8DD69|nr:MULTISPECIES: NAD(P)/FAD-dependent oxidoreductase [unclassified Archaeoglobus]